MSCIIDLDICDTAQSHAWMVVVIVSGLASS